MSKTEIINHSNDESSAGKFGDQPTLLSGNTISNEAEGGMLNTMTTDHAAMRYEHTLMTKEAFDKFLDAAFDGADYRFMSYTGDYYSLEYLNSPCGVIVFAFHDRNGLDTFYPASFDFKERTGITPFDDMITPATDNDNPGFLRHAMGRKVNGYVVHGAFGEMVPEGDPRAISMNEDFRRIDVFDSPAGLIVAAHMGRRRYVIHSTVATLKRAIYLLAGDAAPAKLRKGNAEFLTSISRKAGLGKADGEAA